MDTYQRRARVYPVLLTTFPAAFLAATIMSAPPAWWKTVVGLAGSAGLLFFVAQIGRTFGRRKQEILFDTWRGKPTTILLRFRDTQNRRNVEWLHSEVEQLVARQLPTEAEELADPIVADAAYDAAVHRLRELRRDRRRFPLVFEENCSYGFRRNLYGLRQPGKLLAWGCMLASAALLLLSMVGALDLSRLGMGLSLLVAITAIALWTWIVNEEWVREAAFAYAEALLSSASNPSATPRWHWGRLER